MLKKTTANGRQSAPRGAAQPEACASRLAQSRLAGAVLGLAALCGATILPETASAQEILLTGPLAGAGAVHSLRLYRQGRFEFAPTATFTLLDEYLRQILVGARLNYNLTDYLALGAWGGFSPEALQFEAGLTDRIQEVNEARGDANEARRNQNLQPNLQNRLTSLNLGQNFEDQLGSIDWIVAPQITFVPFRGKIALFQSIYIDSELYFFAGPAIAGLTERAECSGPTSASLGGCNSEVDSGQFDANGDPIPIPNSQTFPMASRIAIAPTFGLGFTFYVNRWNALGFEWRAVPFSRNTGGFDNHGGGPDGEFPDAQVNADDRDLKLNQMLSVSWNFYLPLDYRVSE
ncbi:MAG TPA: hypothetical protein VNN80_05175 [Polyangiaceae bacterium]|nr:hypothetical protein [Polyangiaceae bacterium]